MLQCFNIGKEVKIKVKVKIEVKVKIKVKKKKDYCRVISHVCKLATCLGTTIPLPKVNKNII